MRSTSSSLDSVDDGEGGGGVTGGEGARARRGTGRCAPGGGAGRATQGLGPNQAWYRDNMPAQRASADWLESWLSGDYIPSGNAEKFRVREKFSIPFLVVKVTWFSVHFYCNF